jgi:predicted DNA-binding transcriptional regulator AlpA
MPETTLLSVPDTQTKLGGLGRTMVFALMASGELPPVHIGRRVFIPSDVVEKFIDRRRLAALPAPTSPEAA